MLNADNKIAYLAGFFDGEGCVYILRARRRSAGGRSSGRFPVRDGWYNGYSLEISFTNSELDPLRLAERLFGGKVTSVVDARPGHRIVSRLRLRSREAARALKQMLPHLRVKHRHAEIAIAFQAQSTSGQLTEISAERAKSEITSLNDKVWNSGATAVTRAGRRELVAQL